eukprot:gnl/MRDRNA2_/MRDRNA2_146440_c0_seq1.p1 gnl/MRDRNA2_/MRDRNA2_146440_c0~~gnl/MRDRNA2_/MRDRNA2_146440_c0_seq1.p1  ORF type:complete len:439 (-),score=71.13 gnl/MRDRNA2_/MRDRNA2_146440_c0_seq1:47-1363(-)
MVRLFSLLHGIALQQVAVSDAEDEDFKVLDPGGLGGEQLAYLRKFKKRARSPIVMQWILRTVTEAEKTGVVDAPAPIVSRVFSECNSGMLALAKMRAIAELPFPVPYSKMVTVLLCVHLFITPFYAVGFTNARFWAAVYSFVTVFSLWCIQFISVELEQPFNDGIDDLDLVNSQREMNDSLITLLYSQTQWPPNLDHIDSGDGQHVIEKLAWQQDSKSATPQGSASPTQTVPCTSLAEIFASKDSLIRERQQPRECDLAMQRNSEKEHRDAVTNKRQEPEFQSIALSAPSRQEEQMDSPLWPVDARQTSNGVCRTERYREESNDRGYRDRGNQNEGGDYDRAADVIDTASHFDIPIELNTASCASDSLPKMFPRDRQRELKIQILQNTEHCLQTSEHCIELFNSVADASIHKANGSAQATIGSTDRTIASKPAAHNDP